MLPAIGFYKRHAVRAMGDQMLSIGTANALGLPPREVTTVLVAFAQTRVEHRPFFDFIRPVLQQNAACLSGKEAAFALEASRRVGMADQLLVGTLVSRFVEATEADIESKARFSRLLCIEVAHCANLCRHHDPQLTRLLFAVLRGYPYFTHNSFFSTIYYLFKAEGGQAVRRFVDENASDFVDSLIEDKRLAPLRQPEHAAKSLRMLGEARCRPATVLRHVRTLTAHYFAQLTLWEAAEIARCLACLHGRGAAPPTAPPTTKADPPSNAARDNSSKQSLVSPKHQVSTTTTKPSAPTPPSATKTNPPSNNINIQPPVNPEQQVPAPTTKVPAPTLPPATKTDPPSCNNRPPVNPEQQAPPPPMQPPAPVPPPTTTADPPSDAPCNNNHQPPVNPEQQVPAPAAKAPAPAPPATKADPPSNTPYGSNQPAVSPEQQLPSPTAQNASRVHEPRSPAPLDRDGEEAGVPSRVYDTLAGIICRDLQYCAGKLASTSDVAAAARERGVLPVYKTRFRPAAGGAVKPLVPAEQALALLVALAACQRGDPDVQGAFFAPVLRGVLAFLDAAVREGLLRLLCSETSKMVVILESLHMMNDGKPLKDATFLATAMLERLAGSTKREWDTPDVCKIVELCGELRCDVGGPVARVSSLLVESVGSPRCRWPADELCRLLRGICFFDPHPILAESLAKVTHQRFEEQERAAATERVMLGETPAATRPPPSAPKHGAAGTRAALPCNPPPSPPPPHASTLMRILEKQPKGGLPAPDADRAAGTHRSARGSTPDAAAQKLTASGLTALASAERMLRGKGRSHALAYRGTLQALAWVNSALGLRCEPGEIPAVEATRIRDLNKILTATQQAGRLGPAAAGGLRRAFAELTRKELGKGIGQGARPVVIAGISALAKANALDQACLDAGLELVWQRSGPGYKPLSVIEAASLVRCVGRDQRLQGARRLDRLLRTRVSAVGASAGCCAQLFSFFAASSGAAAPPAVFAAALSALDLTPADSLSILYSLNGLAYPYEEHVGRLIDRLVRFLRTSFSTSAPAFDVLVDAVEIVEGYPGPCSADLVAAALPLFGRREYSAGFAVLSARRAGKVVVSKQQATSIFTNNLVAFCCRAPERHERNRVQGDPTEEEYQEALWDMQGGEECASYSGHIGFIGPRLASAAQGRRRARAGVRLAGRVPAAGGGRHPDAVRALRPQGRRGPAAGRLVRAHCGAAAPRVRGARPPAVASPPWLRPP
ncbi:hypothetical protein DIPPA_31965 [Diplonema papillatum]|nr:hypothetical protein DIPPA_31965 [Diplonema papillatum]KAJ9443296.1 hypothetical protein DIPPA_31965 [Diplonema papillatum]